MAEGDDLLAVVVRNPRQETELIRSYELHPRDCGAALPAFSPGAHIDVHTASGLVRQYSLVNDPEYAGFYRIGVKLERDGRGGSIAVHAEFAEGAAVRISRPRNHFPLRPDRARSLLLAAGIGITPLLSMAQALARAQAAFELHYFARAAEEVAFADLLGGGVAAKAATLHLGLTPPHVGARLLQLIGQSAFDQIYACGPTPFLEAVRSAAATCGVAPGALAVEHFGAAIADTADSDGAFDLTLRRSGVTCSVAPGQSILDAMRLHGVDAVTSCEQGVCGTCLARVLEGVPDHRDLYLTDEEREAGELIAVCVSRSKTRRLVLDL